MGKGMSIRTGIANMSGDYMIIQDADKEYDPADHVKFCRKVDETGAAAIFGSRVLGGDVQYKYAHAYLGVRFFNGRYQPLLCQPPHRRRHCHQNGSRRCGQIS